MRNAFDRAGQGPGTIAVCGQGGSGKLHHTLAWLNGQDSGPNPLILDACLLPGERMPPGSLTAARPSQKAEALSCGISRIFPGAS